MPKLPYLDRHLGAEPCVVGDWHLEDASEATYEARILFAQRKRLWGDIVRAWLLLWHQPVLAVLLPLNVIENVKTFFDTRS